MPDFLATAIIYLPIAFGVGIIIFIYYTSMELERDKKNLKIEDKQFERLEWTSKARAIYREYLKQNDFDYNSNEILKSKTLQEKEFELCSDFMNKNPVNVCALERRALLYSFFEKYENAINDYKILIKDAPNYFEYTALCAENYAHTGDLRSALNLINNFNKENRKNDEYYAAIGSVLFIVKDYELSIKHYTKAIQLNPYLEEYYSARGKAYMALGQFNKYKKDMQKCNELKQQYTKTRENYALGINSFNTNTGTTKMGFIVKIAVLLISFIVIAYFHPTKEVMLCNHQMVCNIDRTYFGIFNVNKKITLTPYSEFSCQLKLYSHSKGGSDYGLYVSIDGTEPFIFYIEGFLSPKYPEYVNSICEKNINWFKEYLNNHEKYLYKLESQASTVNLMFGLLMIFIILIIMFADDIKNLKNIIFK